MVPQKLVGIDVSKDSFTLAILSPEDGSFSTHTLSFSHKDLRRLPFLLNYPCRIAVESSGPYSTLLMGNLRKMGLRPLLINPLRIKRFSSSLSLRLTKTDPIDARTIALLLASDHNTAPSPDPKRQSLAQLSRQVEALSQSIASLKNRIRQLLHTLFPELPNHINPFSKSVLHLLLAFPSAQALSRASEEAIARALRRAVPKRGRKLSLSPHQLKELARRSIGLSDPAREALLQSLIRQLLLLEEEKRLLSQELIRRARELAPCAWETLLTIPGMGELSAATLIAEIGDISRFPGAKQLVAYAGLDPSVYESGKIRRRSRISKRGNPHLRRILFILAQHVVRRTRTFYAYFRRLRRKGKAYRQAMVAVAHKLLRVIYALLTKGSPFQDNYSPNS